MGAKPVEAANRAQDPSPPTNIRDEQKKTFFMCIDYYTDYTDYTDNTDSYTDNILSWQNERNQAINKLIY